MTASICVGGDLGKYESNLKLVISLLISMIGIWIFACKIPPCERIADD